MSRKPEVFLEDWEVCEEPCYGRGKHLHGTFHGHPDKVMVGEGEWGTTSEIVWIDTAAGIAETKNTMYSLGVPKGATKQ